MATENQLNLILNATERMKTYIQITTETDDQKVLDYITASKTKTSYSVDEEIKIDDLTVTAFYTDGTSEEITNYGTNIDDIDTFTDGYKKLEIYHCDNGVVKTTTVPITVNFTNSADNVQYGYCILDSGRLLNGSMVVKLTTKLLKRSIVNIRLRAKVVIERNSNTGYTTVGFGNYTAWHNNTVAGSVILSPRQTGEFIIECNKELEYELPNLKLKTNGDTTLLAIYNNGGNKVHGRFEILDYSISVTQEAPLIVETISATKVENRFIAGNDVDTTDVVVTATMSDDTTKTVTNYTTEIDVDNVNEYGETPLSIIYTEDGVTRTATVTLRMYRALLTEPQEFEDIDNFEFHNRLGLGINMGNCLDSKGKSTDDPADCGYDWYPNQETLWGQPEIIRQNFIDIREKGFNTVRIPVTWSYNSGILEDGNRHISKFWLARVSEIVQIGLEEGLYIMINMHHEQPFIYTGVSEALFEKVLKNAADMWTEIADTLKYFNERLIFEGFNEVDNLEASFTYGEKAAKQMNRLNQVFVDTVRASGGNNDKRILAVPTSVHMNNIAALNAFVVPTDTVENKLILAVHGYPLTFSQDLENTLRPLEEASSKYNLPVLITEWGSDNKGGNGGESKAFLPYGAEQRPDHAANFMARTTNRGIKSYWWDNGSNFSLVIRCNKLIDYGYKQEELDVIIDSLKDGYYNKTAFVLPENNVIQYSSFDGLKYERLNLTTGESKYASWSDVCTDYIPVTGGKGIIIELIKGATAVAEKIAFCSVVYLDENKVPIETFTAPYMSNYYSKFIPADAAYMRFSINSPHNNTKEEVFKEMFATGDLTIAMVTYSKEEITKVTLENRTISETLVEKTNQMYEIGDEINTDDITVRAVLNDGTTLYIHDFTVDGSDVDNTTAGEYLIILKYQYGEDTRITTIPVFVGEVLSSISAVKTSTTYFVGSVFDDSDIVVSALYSSGESVDVTESCTIDSSTVDTSTVGTYEITVTYTEGEITKTYTIPVIVKEFDVSDYVDEETTVITASEITTSTFSSPLSEEEINSKLYIIGDANNPQSVYFSDKPMYRNGNYVVFDITCTSFKKNGNAMSVFTPNSSGIKQVIGDYYCNTTKHWMLTKANYDVKKWIGGNLP